MVKTLGSDLISCLVECLKTVKCEAKHVMLAIKTIERILKTGILVPGAVDNDAYPIDVNPVYSF